MLLDALYINGWLLVQPGLVLHGGTWYSNCPVLAAAMGSHGRGVGEQWCCERGREFKWWTHLLSIEQQACVVREGVSHFVQFG
jgi:hypothetical protein